jgi:membrane-bound serine protease (ClpP class)
MTIRRSPIVYLLLLLAGLVSLAAQGIDSASRTVPQVVQMEIDGTIGPVTVEYFRSGLERADEVGADLVLLRLDTPGGLDAAMRDIVKEILAARIPIVGYVAPAGARAASAGTYILYACHVAAMAPATNLGSATPVQLGGLPSVPAQPDADDAETAPADNDGAGDGPAAAPAPDSAMERKLVNDAAAFIRGLAQLRGRDVDWAEQAVRSADNLTAAEALERGVIDLVAPSEAELLARIDGRIIEILGEAVALDTDGAAVENFEPDWRTKLLSVITDPNIAYVLMLVGVYGLVYELANPGAIVPGVIGAISLVTALFAFQALPVNYAGLALVLLGVGFMVLEAFVPSFGALGIGGAIAFVFGSVILYHDDAGQFGVAIPLIITFTVLSAALFIWVLAYALKSRGKPVVSGREELLHATGIVDESFERRGRVKVHSELWNARSQRPLRRGQRIRVTGIDGLVLEVEPLNDGD